ARGVPRPAARPAARLHRPAGRSAVDPSNVRRGSAGGAARRSASVRAVRREDRRYPRGADARRPAARQPGSQQLAGRRQQGHVGAFVEKDMLSRVADALFWMSRYVERAEHIARLLDVWFHLELDLSGAGAAPFEMHWTALASILQQQ